MTDTNHANHAASATLASKRQRKIAREPKPETASQGSSPAPAKRVSKTDLVLDLLQRPEGATIDQMVAATGWLPHTTRAALTGLRKKGHALVSEKLDGARRYRIGGGAA